MKHCRAGFFREAKWPFLVMLIALFLSIQGAVSNVKVQVSRHGTTAETSATPLVRGLVDEGVEATSQPAEITIDGQFDDWSEIPVYNDPTGDTHDTNPRTKYAVPRSVQHPDVDLVLKQANSKR